MYMVRSYNDEKITVNTNQRNNLREHVLRFNYV